MGTKINKKMVKNEIKYVDGDATEPIGEGIKIIVHVSNNIGAWGAGFVLALSAKWVQPEAEYKRLSPKVRKLGNIQIVPVGDNTYVVNMIGQDKCSPNEYGVPPVRYGAIQTCLKKVANFARIMDNGTDQVSIHMCRIGCGLAGGKWSIMEKVIEEAVDDISVTVYDYVPKQIVILT